MKKNFAFLTSLCTLSLSIFVSCGSNDKEPEIPATQPSFSVKADAALVATPTETNPTQITVAEEGASVVLATTSSHAVTLSPTTALPEGWSITPGVPTVASDKSIVQEFTILIPQNGLTERKQDFVIANSKDAALVRQFTLIQKPKLPIMPLAYVAQYNLNKEGTAFVETYDNAENARHLVSWDEVAKASVEGYHVPTIKELAGIIPTGSFVQFNHPIEKGLDRSEEVVVGGFTMTCISDYHSTGEEPKAYAIRYKDNINNLRSAWKYEIASNPSGEGFILVITCRYLGSSLPDLDVKELAQASFWSNNATNDVVRYFPASGQVSYGSNRDINKEGHFWASDLDERGYPQGIKFSVRNAQTSDYYSKGYGHSVRLFENTKK